MIKSGWSFKQIEYEIAHYMKIYHRYLELTYYVRPSCAKAVCLLSISKSIRNRKNQLALLLFQFRTNVMFCKAYLVFV